MLISSHFHAAARYSIILTSSDKKRGRYTDMEVNNSYAVVSAKSTFTMADHRESYR